MANQISKEIVQHIIDSGNDQVTIENDSFLTALLTRGQKPIHFRTARFIGLSLVLIFSLGFVIYSASFYIQNVLLYKADMHINQYGAFVRRSLNSEYAMFLYDPAEPWAVSGIQVQHGDKMFVTGSGAYHTNYSRLINATEKNRWADRREMYAINDDSLLNVLDTLICRYIDVATPPSKIEIEHPYAIDTLYRKVSKPRHLKYEALFGDVLIQIVPEYIMRDANHLDTLNIYAVPRMLEEKKESISVEQGGVLTFGVNDDIPLNNVGQILVAMEIYHKQTWVNAALKIFKGHFMDLPYFWYDYWSHAILHNNWWFWFVSLIFVLWVMIEYLIFCAILYFLPFLFIKDTWKPVINLPQTTRRRSNIRSASKNRS